MEIIETWSATFENFSSQSLRVIQNGRENVVDGVMVSFLSYWNKYNLRNKI